MPESIELAAMSTSMQLPDHILFRLSHTRKTYRTGEADRPALDIQSLDIPKNKIVAILGESGSGKTTLLNLLGMLDVPDTPSSTTTATASRKYSSIPATRTAVHPVPSGAIWFATGPRCANCGANPSALSFRKAICSKI